MKKIRLLFSVLFISSVAMAQTTGTTNNSSNTTEPERKVNKTVIKKFKLEKKAMNSKTIKPAVTTQPAKKNEEAENKENQ